MLQSPFNYTGTKYPLLSQLKYHFPKHITKFYDLFTGGGSVAFNIDADQIFASDIIEPLIKFYKLLQEINIDDLVTELYAGNPINKTDYLKLRTSFNDSQDPVDFFQLVCSCTNNMLRFNRDFKFNQTYGRRGFNPQTEIRLRAYAAKIKTIIFKCCSFKDITIPKDAFVYLDPPYILTQAGYNAYWSNLLERELCDFLHTLDNQGIKFCYTTMRIYNGQKNPYEYYWKHFNIFQLESNYDKISRHLGSITDEVLVRNY